MEGKEKEGEELRKRADPLNINSGYGSGTAPSLKTTSRCRHLSTLTLSSCFFFRVQTSRPLFVVGHARAELLAH